MSADFVIPDWLAPAEPPPQPVVADVDPHQVEGLVNRFIAGKQEALFTAPDAYYRTTGADAVDGAPALLDRLDAMRDATLEAAGDDGTRFILGPRLDVHLDDVRDGVGRHVARQQDEFARQVISERQSLLQRAAELEHTDDDKLAGLAEANASAARELARLNGQAERPAMDSARSTIWHSAIAQRIANGDGAGALELFQRARHQLNDGHVRSLATPLQVARQEQAADQWIASQAAIDGPPLEERLDADPNLSPEGKYIVRAKVDARNSAEESRRAATVQALNDQVQAALGALATRPGTYKTSTFARAAEAYAAAGEPGKAEATRRLALQESTLAAFAQASADKQQRLIDELPPGDLRTNALAIQRRQTDSFTRDAFAAGTALYAEVGPPAPIDDIQGRVRQARQIAQRRGAPTVPFTTGEIADMQQALATGSDAEKKAIRSVLATMPSEMQAAIEPAASGTPEVSSPGAERPLGEDKPSPSSNAGESADNPLAGADVHVVHQDDGSAKVTANGVQTPAGTANVSFSTDRERRSASAETVLPDGRRIESRRTTSDGRAWSQIDTVRDADGTVRATLTTTFDGTRYSQTYTPADGEARTATWNAAQDPGSPVQQVGYDEVLPYAAMGAAAGIAAIASAPVAAAAGLLGVALLALSLKGDSGDQGKAAPLETKPPQESDEDGEGEQQRPGIGHNSGKTPDPDDDRKPPPGGTAPIEAAQSGQDDPDKERRETERVSRTISKGHAYQKHVIDRGEFPEIHSPEDFANHIDKVMNNPTHKKSKKDGRTVYWDDPSGTIVFRNPKDPDGGTAFRPRDGKAYFDKQ
jgi:hypothetical protein